MTKYTVTANLFKPNPEAINLIYFEILAEDEDKAWTAARDLARLGGKVQIHNNEYELTDFELMPQTYVITSVIDFATPRTLKIANDLAVLAGLF